MKNNKKYNIIDNNNHIVFLTARLSRMSTEGRGGAEKFIRIARAFNADTQLPNAVLLYAGSATTTEYINNLQCIDLGCAEKKFSIYSVLTKVIPKLTIYLYKYKPVAVIASDNRAILAAIIAKILSRSHTKIVGNIVDTLSYRWKAYSKIKSIFMRFMLKLLYPRLHKIIALSEGIASDIYKLTNVDGNRISVIYNPVVTESLFIKSREDMEHPWFKDKSIPIILGVGRLTKQKDFSNLIHAFSIILKKRNARLVILGEGEERSNLEKLTKRLSLEDKVDLPGFVKNPYNFIRWSDVFVLSSKWEGLPTVLIEALAIGTPVISTNCFSGPSEILQEGKYGQLIPVGDIQAMATAIDETLERKNLYIPEEAWNRFTVENIIQKYKQTIASSNNT